MSRRNVNDTETTYERAFRSLLWRLRAPSLQRGVHLLSEKARQKTQQGLDPQTAFAAVYTRARARVICSLVHSREAFRSSARGAAGLANLRAAEQTRATLENSIARHPLSDSADFFCDSGLGGMARWLRAAGYDARFWPYIDDDDLIQRTIHSSAILLTTDGPLMNRSAVVWGAIPALLVPLPIGKHEQFRFVAGELCLPRKTSRCMACGGSLVSVHKEAVRDRIPPRTYPWRDEYYECARCGKLLWHGTHWNNVQRLLSETMDERLKAGD